MVTRTIRRFAFASLLLAAGAVATSAVHAEEYEPSEENVAVAEAPPPPNPPSARGVASWYGPGFHGRRTASGEKFDMNALTAAHRTLPFGTLVRVRSLVNGATVDVRINDRGPYIKRRLIDLSRGAAKALGLIDAGTGTKQIELIVMGEAGAGAGSLR